MTTKRLFYEDAYTTRFEANVLERMALDGARAVVLDKTYFYPSSGGQPADYGRLGEREVVDVFIREADGAVVHLLDDELFADSVTGIIDWSRRFDHMQQHSGQHILSRAFNETAGARTVSFHLSDNSVTIDLQPAKLKASEVEATEFLANQIIWENRPIHVRLVTEEQAARLPLRHLPKIEADKIRLIEIKGFDLTACGGTHVRRTGEVGMIKLVGLKRQREHLRVEFVCGQRALADYRSKNQVLNRLAVNFTTGYTELEHVTDLMREEVKDLSRQVRKKQSQLLRYEARWLRDDGLRTGPGERFCIVCRTFTERDPGEVYGLAQQLASYPGTIALLGLAGEKSLLFFARAEDAPGEMNRLIKQSLQLLKGGGGGSETFAQGGGLPASDERVTQALVRAKKLLLATIP